MNWEESKESLLSDFIVYYFRKLLCPVLWWSVRNDRMTQSCDGCLFHLKRNFLCPHIVCVGMSVFRLPVVVSAKQKATMPLRVRLHLRLPRVTNTSPRTLPRWTQSNKQCGFFYWKTECLLERANDLIVDCVSMSECLTKLPTRAEGSRESR